MRDFGERGVRPQPQVRGAATVSARGMVLVFGGVAQSGRNGVTLLDTRPIHDTRVAPSRATSVRVGAPGTDSASNGAHDVTRVCAGSREKWPTCQAPDVTPSTPPTKPALRWVERPRRVDGRAEI